MPRVSSVFGLPLPVPFVDVRVERDNRLFIEPSAIRYAAAGGDPLAQRAELCLTTFFSEVLDSVRRGQRTRGLRLLSHLHEPNETRLGMTSGGVKGHGVGVGIAESLWDEMASNAACAQAILVNRVEDLAPYVDKIGPDLVSDLSTRIAFDVLIDFTTQMMTRYPRLTSCTSIEAEEVWDAAQARWASRQATLPVANGDRLLLIPTNWVWPSQLLNATSFYQVQALGRIQDRMTEPARVKGQKPWKPTKLALRDDYPSIRPTNIQQAVAAATDGVNLTDRHARRVQQRLQSMSKTPAEINSLI